MKYSFESRSVKETHQFGVKLAKCLASGTVIGFEGGLGSGKTTLIQGISEGLGVPREDVKSPTFVIFHIYKGTFPVYHFDLYRLEKAQELEVIGFDEFIADEKAVSLIEWADKAGSELPHDLILIHLKTKSPDEREFKLEARGEKSKKILERLAKK